MGLTDILGAFPLAMQYRRLRGKVFGGLESGGSFRCADNNREPELERITEKFLYYLWAEQPIKGLFCRSDDNRAVNVGSHGLWNSGPGPDFTGAAIEIGGRLFRGDVEMHLYSSDWYRHKHHLDKRYNNLALHITLWDDSRKRIILSDKKEVAQIVLAPSLRDKLEDIEKLLELDVDVKQGQYYVSAGRCYELLARAPIKKSVLFLEGAGESRLLRKMDILSARLAGFDGDYDEVLYQVVMGALGYRNNQLPFLRLAEDVPYRKIRAILKDYPANQRALIIQSLLLRQAGLMPDKTDGFDSEAKSYLDSLSSLPRHYDGSNRPEMDWRLSGGRPVNSPYRRIAGISYLLGKTDSLFNKVLSVLNSPIECHAEFISASRKTLKQVQGDNDGGQTVNTHKSLTQLLFVPPAGFWSIRSGFTGKPFSRAQALIGKERAESIVLNVAIPLVLLYARSNKDNKLQDSVCDLYSSYPKLTENYYTRFMKQRLFNSDAKLYSGAVKSASAQQGLIEIFTDFCKKGYEGCERCGLREWLKG